MTRTTAGAAGAGAPASDPLGVAVIGYGLAGAAFHAPLIHATAGLSLAAVVTSDPERSSAARARYPGAAVVADVDRLWAMDGLDIAVIATPNRTHVRLGREALEAGLHVVVDKPVAPTVAGARRLVEEARRRDRVLTVYHNRRWDGDFLTLRRLIAEDALGEVYRFESRFERWRPVPEPGWRQSPEPGDAGGLLYDLGPHLVDQALQLFGPVRDVHAELDRRRTGSRVDDDTFLALSHESGVRSHLWMNAIAARPGPRFRVLGSRGTWTKHGLDVQETRLRAGLDPRDPGLGAEPKERRGVLDDGRNRRLVPTEPGAYLRFYEALEAAVRRGAPPPVDPRDAIDGLRIIERALDAAM
ncbi:MAG: Gfo/Idh/MocA family protein [Gemmatimonadota bacterium]